MRDKGKYLFHKFDGHSLQEHMKKKLKDAIANLSELQVKGTNLDDWIIYFEQEFKIDVPKLDRDGVSMDVNDEKLDARQFRSRFAFRDENRPIMVDGNVFHLHIPFQGDPELFNCSGNRIMHNSVYADIADGELVLTYEDVDHDVDKINSSMEKDISFIEGFLNELRSYFTEYNNSIKGQVSSHLAQRIEKFKKDDELKSKLKFPLRKREGQVDTYKAPGVRRKVSVSRPTPAQTGNSKPEPVLDEEEYNNILTIIQNMALTMERSPNAFKSIGEEDLRQFFLVALNGHYEGNASGETFNFGGKTDILIKHEGKNIFIAECKYWSGGKTVTDTIDQLLNYVSWRDTKTSIVLFNRNKNLSAVLAQIPDLVSAHSLFEKKLNSALGVETEFRYLFKHREDNERKLFLTILVFDVPQ